MLQSDNHKITNLQTSVTSDLPIHETPCGTWHPGRTASGRETADLEKEKHKKINKRFFFFFFLKFPNICLIRHCSSFYVWIGSGFRAVSDFEYMQIDLDKIPFQRGASFREKDFNTRILITHYGMGQGFWVPRTYIPMHRIPGLGRGLKGKC